jgi:hypothetical protein
MVVLDDSDILNIKDNDLAVNNINVSTQTPQSTCALVYTILEIFECKILAKKEITLLLDNYLY